MTGVTLADSVVFGHLWATGETRALFDDRGRTTTWVEILAALALAQAELGIVPRPAAEAIATAAADAGAIDLDAVGEETRRSGHSTLGLIRVLQRALPEAARDWVSYGATVQDVADTWTGLVARTMLDLLERDLAAAEQTLLCLADRHRGDPMLGRTHGQPGLPITFGFKAAGWAAELRRTRLRAQEARPRLAVGQLAGAVGTQSSFGARGPLLQRAFLDRLGLALPDIGWLTARDRVAELVSLLALATGALARIGNEVYNLQRPELGELREAVDGDVVGSITMPQKRNPELSEQLVTLARVVRAALVPAFEGLVGEHERDGATWKGEWIFLPQACTAAGAALAFGVRLLDGLQVDAVRMRDNVDAQRGYVLAEPVMLALAEHVGKPRAHALVHAAARSGHAAGLTLRDALLADADVVRHLDAAALDELLRAQRALGAVDELIDRVLTPDPERR
ncbi:adenylosuccinate lyase family protein [Conexibacter sp. CPCC 206217]|uniref:class-II fumarase/aspartase family protein n=1 Tax=Conexibacter sp. CPCC 206217 TaxID=3064574 RepID=UPI002727708A|nr:adenylosuccinate lyase family protein [Conexibacter sp. CPCC 206217]MDO8212355.1 adenylosuccinate lyase family protein [Conexibacter sp. CPCC 206217]